MESIPFTWGTLWCLLSVFIGLILIFLGFKTLIKEIKIKKTGIKTTAKVIGFSYEKSLGEDDAPIKIPVFIFYDNLNHQKSVKGKSNSICKMYDTTPIYYNPENPEKEYYLPEKDFMVKFLLFLFGMIFLCLGVYCIHKIYAEFISF